MNIEQFNELAPRIVSEDVTRPSLMSAFRHRGHLIATDSRFALVVASSSDALTPSIEGQIRAGDNLLDEILPNLGRACASGSYQPVRLGLAYPAACAAIGDLHWDMDFLTSPLDCFDDEEACEPDPPSSAREAITSYSCCIFGLARALFSAYYIYLLCRISHDYTNLHVWVDPCDPHKTLFAEGENVRIALQPRLVELKSQAPWDFPFSGPSFADCETGRLVRSRQPGTFCIHTLRFPPRPSPLAPFHVSASHTVIEHATCAIKPESGVN